jgi:hypothetical protein
LVVLLKNQSGSALILVALSMLMIIGFVAIVVDVGGLYFEKSRLQKALDAGVLGGAQVLKLSGATAKSTGIELALENGFSVTTDEVTTGTNFIEITKTVKKELTFARLLGFKQTDVRATARAETVQTLLAGDGIIPVALEQKEYKKGEPYTMHFQAGNPNNSSIKGNFGFLAIDGPGGNDLEEGIKHGSTLEVSEEFVWTKTGLTWGKVRDGFKYRLAQDLNNVKCQSYQTADNSCSRVITVPIIETFSDAKGKSLVRIIGFAAFWIDSIDETGNDKGVTGRFIEHVRGGTFGTGEDFGIYGVKLVN